MAEKQEATPKQEEPQNYQSKKLIALTTLLFLLGATAGVSMLYISAANSAADKDEEIVSLRNEIGVIKQQSSAENEVDEQEAASNSVMDSQVEYEAKVGQFVLRLDDPFVAIVHDDGKTEGTALTDIEVGQMNDDGTISANSSLTRYDIVSSDRGVRTIDEQLAGWRQADLELVDRGTVEVGGVDAPVYERLALGGEFRILLERDNAPLVILYVSDLESPRTKAILSGLTLN